MTKKKPAQLSNFHNLINSLYLDQSASVLFIESSIKMTSLNPINSLEWGCLLLISFLHDIFIIDVLKRRCIWSSVSLSLSGRLADSLKPS